MSLDDQTMPFLSMKRSSTKRANIQEGAGELRQVLECGSPLPLSGPRPKAPEGRRTPRRWRDIVHSIRFMVPRRAPSERRLSVNHRKVGTRGSRVPARTEAGGSCTWQPSLGGQPMALLDAARTSQRLAPTWFMVSMGNLLRPGRLAVRSRWFIDWFVAAKPVGSILCGILFLLGLVWADPLAAEEARPASYYQDVVPLFKRSCNGCHYPGKLKGQLDLTTFEGLQKGGKHGPGFKAGDPKSSGLIEEISGAEPSMPKEGEPLNQTEIALIERWILEGAKNDTPATAQSFKLTEPPVYNVAPVISALAYSPDGQILAVSGFHEVLLHKSDGTGLLGRLLGESTRIESLAFSADGRRLAVAGGAPARFGEIQIWEMPRQRLLNSFKPTYDSVYGVSFSPDAERIAFGCVDKTARLLSVKDGKELLKFDNHSDWVLATTFTGDGKRILTGSRDRAMKLIDAANGQFIDDINKLLEEILCLTRHPKLDQAAYGGALGAVRIYRISENQGRTAANNDVNLVREFERQPGPAYAIAFSPDGTLLAVGGVAKEVRVYRTVDGSRAATLKGHDGAIFCLAFHPRRNEIATAGFDGRIRIYDSLSGNAITNFIPVPIKEVQQAAN